ncbi:MAG: linear amide C-N hydrolase [Pseudoflavonifractor sp.]|nr:linear amide C-N hydrolase [Pseudoflavonifractor sp.]
MKLSNLLFPLAIIAAATVSTEKTSACSRAVLLGDDNLTIVGRTLDWRTPIPTNLYVYPRGMQRQSMPQEPMLQWTSQYGSVIAVSYDGGVTEGMNEKGLVMNGLFCKGSVYKESTGAGDTPVMSLAVLVSYFLDNFATVNEVKSWLDNNEFAIFGKTFDGGTVSLLHWALTDPTGVTLIMEYQNGKLDLYMSRDYQVLTNDPAFPDMQAINTYWQNIGGINMLPGTVRSSDRFVRASFFINHLPTAVDAATGVAEVATVMNNVSVPLGYEVEGHPNLSSTQWMSISDTKNLVYYFKFAEQQAMFNIDLQHLDLYPGAPVLKLDTTKEKDLHGCVNNKLHRSEPFTPMW